MSLTDENGNPIDPQSAPDPDPDESPEADPAQADEAARDPIQARRVIALIEDENGQVGILTKCQVVGVDCDEAASLPEAHRMVSGADATLRARMTASATVDALVRLQAMQRREPDIVPASQLPPGAVPRR